MSRPYTLYAIESVLGPPDQLVAGEGPAQGRVRALWSCGCEAAGRRLIELEIAPCRAHRDRLEAPPAP